jgi:hypothetical protein
MMHVSYKVRHFQIERSVCAEAIEQLCLGFAVPYDTEGAEKYVFREEIRRNLLRPLERGFYEVKSYHLVYLMYIGLMAMLFYLAFIESLHISLIYQMLFQHLYGQQLLEWVHSYNRVAAIYACCATIILILILIGFGRLQRWLRGRRRREGG